MTKINQEEYEKIKLLPDYDWNWIAREKTGKVISFTNKPAKTDEVWKDSQTRLWFNYKDSHLFQFIQWEDEEPYNIAELIEEYERQFEVGTQVYVDYPRYFDKDKIYTINGWWGKEARFKETKFVSSIENLTIIDESEETEVKKDKQWLEKELRNLEKLVKEALEASLIAKNEHYTEKNSNELQLLRRVFSLVDQLDEPEVLSQEWIDENKKDSGVHYIGYYVPIGRLHDLLVPKQELPVIPQFVAGYLDFAKSDVPLMRVMELAKTRNEWPKWEKEYDWISANDEKFARAWIDGYTVEEKKYRIHFGNHKYAQRFNEKWLSSQITDKEFASTFTKEEIINLDNSDLYWNNFAEEVTE